MANVFTAGGSGANWDNLVETAYDRAVDFYLRDAPQWRQVIDKHPVAQAMPGDTITLTLHNAIAGLATTPLTETVDPDSVAPPAPTRVNVTMNEYGNATLATLKLNTLAFTEPTRELAELVGRNMYDTMDALVRAIADAGTNILYVNGGVNKTSGGALNSVVATDLLLRSPAVVSGKLLARAKVARREGDAYFSLIHPDVSFDLMAENSATAWVGPHTYGTDTAAIYAGEIGKFQGIRFMETTRTNIVANSVPVNVYTTYVMGRQAIVEAMPIQPHIVLGPQVDKLKRFNPLGWHALGGWALYRPTALVQIKTASSIGAL